MSKNRNAIFATCIAYSIIDGFHTYEDVPKGWRKHVVKALVYLESIGMTGDKTLEELVPDKELLAKYAKPKG